MIRGQRAGVVFEKALDTYLATIADHGFNASTFTARVVASTHAGLISSVLAALCALKGPLHGGAPGPVLDMLDEIGDASRAEAWFDDAFAKGTTLMGFGHRIYKVRDPRADVLKQHRGDAAGDGRPAAPMPPRSRRAPSPRCASTSPAGGSTPTSSTTPRCCSRRSKCRAAPSPPCSRSAAPPAGARTSSSRRRAAASSARNRTMSGRGPVGLPDRRPAPGSGAGAGGVEHPDDDVAAGRREADVEMAPPEAAVGVAEQRLGAERSGGRSGRRARRGMRPARRSASANAVDQRTEAQGFALRRAVCIGPPSMRSQTTAPPSSARIEK